MAAYGLPHLRRWRSAPPVGLLAGCCEQHLIAILLCVGAPATQRRKEMTTFLRRVRRSASHLVADSRREFKRVDASRAKYDDGAWLTS
jgi:hypothetical protein